MSYNFLMEKETKSEKNMFTRNSLFRALNIVFCTVSVCALILYANLGSVVNFFLSPEAIKNIVNKNTGLILELVEPEIYATKNLCVNLKSPEIKLIMPDNNEVLMYLKEADTEIKILPLIFKKLDIRRFSALEFFLDVERELDGSFNFQKYLKSGSKTPFSVEAKNALVLLESYKIFLKDKKYGVNAEISGSDFVSSEFNLDSYADIKTNGTIKLSNLRKSQTSSYMVDVKLKFPFEKNLNFDDSKLRISLLNLDLSFFEPYAIEYGKGYIKGLKGKGNLAVLPYENVQNSLLLKSDLDNFFLNIYKNGHENHINIKDKSKLGLALRFKKNEILIDDFNFIKSKVNIAAAGSVKNLSNWNSLNPDILIKIKNSSLKEALSVTPDYLFKLQQDYIPNLKKYKADALVNAEFRIKDRFRYPNMFGTIALREVFILEKPSNAPTSSADITFNGSDVNINVEAKCPNNQKITIKGETEIKELPYVKFNIVSTPLVDIEFAHKILIPIHKIFGFQLGPLPFMTIAGNGEISLTTEGTRESANLNGYFKTKNGTATLEGLNTKLYNGNLNLLFKGKNIIFDNTTGVVEGAKIKIDGHSDVTGKLDLYVNIYDVKAQNALDVVKTSPMVLGLLNGGGFLDAYTNPVGNIDFNMHLWGETSEFGDTMSFEPSDTMQAKGSIIFKNNSIDIFPEIKASKITGTLDFTDFVTLNLNADIYSSPFNLTGTVKADTKASKIRSEQPQIVDLTFKTKSADSKDLYRFFYDNQDGFQSKNKITQELYDFLNKINFKFAAGIRAKGKVEPTDTVIDMKKFTLDGWAVGLNYKESDVVFNSGDVKFRGQKLLFKDLNTSLWGANIVTNGEVDKIFDDYFIPDLKFKLLSFPLAKVTDLLNGDLSSINEDKNLKKVLNDFSDFNGYLDGEFFYNQKGFGGDTNFNNVSVYDKKRDVPVNLNSGNLKFSNNQVKLNALNMSYGHTPVYLDAVLEDFKNPLFNVYVSSNLNEESLDKLVNPMLQFPLRTTGEFSLKGRLRGRADNYTTFATVTVNPGSDLYYMGANLGDLQNKREINTRLDFKDDEVNIKNLKYQKYIISQNNTKETPYEMLDISGGIKTKGDKFVLDNLNVQTPNPAPARLLNPVFKKSVLKQGTFTANLLFEGDIYEPNIRGKAKLTSVDIPLYDAQIRDVDLTMDERLISAAFEATGMKSDVKIVTEILNKPTLPVMINSAEISSKTLDLAAFAEGLAKFSKSQKPSDPSAKSSVNFSPADFEIKSGKIKADEVFYNNIKAKNFSGSFKHTPEGVFAFKDFVFDIAGGKIKSSGMYEFEGAKFTINSKIDDCDANTLATEILGTKNQIFGKTNGRIYLSGKDLNTRDSFNRMNANVEFAIYDGKMPKLGSLEYLLRAGNLLKSGILGFTINNVIEVLIPYKTGEFKKISGDFIVEDGKIDKLNIYSRGDNLSIYTSGSYDIASNIGNFEVLGKLSTKISNLLGPLGNASVNSLVNLFHNTKIDKDDKEDMFQNTDKIPDIAGGSTDFRLFAVKILGDLNADNFVKSFNWLN